MRFQSSFPLVWSLLAMAFVSEAYAHRVPFTGLRMPLEQLQAQVEKEPDSVALILGSGPTGLMSAHQLRKMNLFKTIILVGDRSEYTRTNTVTLRPESFPKLAELELDKALDSKFYFADDFHFFIHLPKDRKVIAESFPGNPKHIDYSQGNLLKVLDGPGWPHYAIKIADFESILAETISANKMVTFLKGSVQKILTETGKTKRHSLRLQFDDNGKQRTLDFINPKLILIAEGGGSKTREMMGIDYRPIPENETQHWCSGAVSLDGILDQSSMNSRITIVSHELTKTVAFGVFRNSENDLFLNGKMSEEESKTWTAEDCLRFNAFKILNEESGFMKMTLPESPAFLNVSDSVAGKFDVALNKASSFHSLENVFLIGDSAGNGSPIGGLGISLITSVYMDALKSLVEGLSRTSAPADVDKVISDYDARVRQIVEFWHFSLKK